MSELVLKIDDTPNYKDGDILCAFNERQIKWKNAELIFWPRIDNDPWKPRVGGYLGNSYPLLQSVLAKIYQHRFERISNNEVIRIDTWSGERVICSPYSTNEEWQMDVKSYVDRRKNGARKPLFGIHGKEVWYGGNSDYSLDNADCVWDDIEYHTQHIRSEHVLWPVGKLDLRHFLFISTDDFDDMLSANLVSPKIKDDQENFNLINVKDDSNNKEDMSNIIYNRKHKVEWKDLPGLSSNTRDIVPNRSVDVNIRNVIKFQISNVIQVK